MDNVVLGLTFFTQKTEMNTVTGKFLRAVAYMTFKILNSYVNINY